MLLAKHSAATTIKISGLGRALGLTVKKYVITAGELPPGAGCQLIDSLNTIGQLQELEEFEQRLLKLEKQLK